MSYCARFFLSLENYRTEDITWTVVGMTKMKTELNQVSNSIERR